MLRYQSKPGSMVAGGFIIGAVEALGAFKETGYHILSDSGLKDPKFDQMYPMQIFCDFFESISTKVGTATLSTMGKNVGASFPLPPELDSVEKFLNTIDSQYKYGTKGLGIDDGWKVKLTGANSATAVFTGPLPDNFIRGLIESMGRKVSKTNKMNVAIDPTQPSIDKGEKSVTLLCTW
jgi:hypothetical protein